MDVIVYSAPWCSDCQEAKRFLDKYSIPYQEINIEAPGAADAVIRNTGKRAIPQFVINGKWVQPYCPVKGFLYEEMSGLLGVSELTIQHLLPIKFVRPVFLFRRSKNPIREEDLLIWPG